MNPGTQEGFAESSYRSINFYIFWVLGFLRNAFKEFWESLNE